MSVNLSEISREYKQQFKQDRVILSFDEFVGLAKDNLPMTCRSASRYILDCFEYFGKTENEGSLSRFKIFDFGSIRSQPVVGGEQFQDDIHRLLLNFKRNQMSDKMIVLHGPNGSAKSTSIDAIAHAMERYSKEPEGAVYQFSWIFPADRSLSKNIQGQGSPIGFGNSNSESESTDSFAFLPESQISAKIGSDFKENPLYLLPLEYREKLLGDDEQYKHLRMDGLSKRNQTIYQQLLHAYAGDLQKVFKHVQVERFYYSKKYRVGIATVEPQMPVDASERQLTMDRSIQNLPAILQNCNLYEASGQLVAANRGMIEFSDMLKRPFEALKYLLSSIENMTISLPSGMANLDVVFFATTNEKYLDQFKSTPDFSSFNSRISLITVPYLTNYRKEKEIYYPDHETLCKTHKVTPHILSLVSLWSVMTRLKKPEPKLYDPKFHDVLSKITPYMKAKLYAGDSLEGFTLESLEVELIQSLCTLLNEESKGSLVYEGRFGASPREVKMILSKVAESCQGNVVLPTDLFKEIESIIKDRSVYEFLQFEVRGEFHDASVFLKNIKDEFCTLFEDELLQSFALIDTNSYEDLLDRYITHCVAYIKKEKIYNSMTKSHEEFSEAIMQKVESILGIKKSADDFRKGHLSKIAAFKIDNPNREMKMTDVFGEYYRTIKKYYYAQKQSVIIDAYSQLLNPGQNKKRESQIDPAVIYKNMQEKFQYTKHMVDENLKFVLNHKNIEI